jgi:hypothetical protein
MIQRVWAFATLPSDRDRSLFLSRIEYLRLTDVVLFVNALEETAFTLPVSRERRLQEVSLELHSRGVSPHLISWLRPTERYMTDAATRLRPLCMTTGARSLLFDAEEPWTHHPSLKGRGARAAEALLQRFWKFDFWPCLLGMSGITFVPAEVKPLTQLCDYVLPQAYSVAKEGTVYRPGVTQRKAYELWSGFGKPMVMGLAAYKPNRYGGFSPAGSMQKAITATEDLAISEVAYWSLRWIVESKERTAFIRQAATKARRHLSQKMALAASDLEMARTRRPALGDLNWMEARL